MSAYVSKATTREQQIQEYIDYCTNPSAVARNGHFINSHKEREAFENRLTLDAAVSQRTPKPNNFCPCQSGRKYKACCSRSEPLLRLGPTEAEIVEIAKQFDALPEEEKRRVLDGETDCRTIGPF